jgi:lipopolysaccharide transport system permease protein
MAVYSIVNKTALLNFWRHRDLLWQMVGNDLRGRYVGSLLGLFWSVIHPLVQIAIYTVVFSQLMQARLSGTASPYAFSIYLCAGLLPWGSFAEIVNRCTGVFWENANLVKKIAFPKTLLHAYVVAVSATNLGILVLLFIVFLWIVDALPPVMALASWGVFLGVQMLFAVGLGLLTSVLNVFFRDVAQLTSLFLQLWFWLTPIVYTVDVLPPWAAAIARYNVMTHFIQVHQALVLRGEPPSMEESVSLMLTAVVMFAVGVGCFRLLRRRIPDEL